MKYAYRWFIPFCLTWLCIVALSSSLAYAQNTIPIPVFPKYMILGVVYAPPGSASSVTYTKSDAVGSSKTVTQGSEYTGTSTTSTTFGGGLFGLGASTTNTTTDGYSTQYSNANTFSVQTTQGNSVATMGPISSSLGVNHDNDVIYIVLNPALTNNATFDDSTSMLTSLTWTGLYSNGCDLSDNAVTPTFYQLLSGCDANQFPYPDVIGIPVWCLKNPYYPGQGCAQWQEYTSRYWDNSYRGPASPLQPNAFPADPLNPPGLTLQDYQDILSADPFVVLNGNTPNVCHPTYGPNFDPNDQEIIPGNAPSAGSVAAVSLSSAGQYTSNPTVTFSKPTGGTAATGTAVMNPQGTAVAYVNITNPGKGYNYGSPSTVPTVTFSGANPATGYVTLVRAPVSCGNSVNSSKQPLPLTMTRFDPYGTVEYPVPGPNGLPTTYSGKFAYQTSTQAVNTVMDSHTAGTSTDTTVGFSQSVGIGIPDTTLSLGLASFNASFSSGSSDSSTFSTQNSNSNTTQDDSEADYSITGPQLSDNYTGPATYNVYMDNVYGTYAFYSNMEPKVTLGTIAINPMLSQSSAPIISNTLLEFAPVAINYGQPTAPTPDLKQIILTNNSIYPLTMAGPAVTFSDPGFQLVENDQNHPDYCSNQMLAAYSTANNSLSSQPVTPDYCTLWIEFAPLPSDAPNLVTLTNPVVQASIIAAGTENANSYQNILVTSSETVVGPATGGTQGATLLPAGATLATPNAIPYIFRFALQSVSSNPISETQSFTFTNYYSSSVTISSISLSDTSNFSIPSTNCYSSAVLAGSSCTLTLQFSPNHTSTAGQFNTAMTVVGTAGTIPVTATAGAVAALGGLTARAIFPGSNSNYITLNCHSGEASEASGPCNATANLTITNNTTQSRTPTISITVTNSPTTRYDPLMNAIINGGCPTAILPGNSCTTQLAFVAGSLSSVPNGNYNIEASIAVTTESAAVSANTELGINLWNYLSSNNAIKIALAGSEKSTQKKIPATHATGTITLKNLSQSKDTNLSETEQETLSSEISSVNAAKGTTITIDVGTLKTSVLIPSATTASTAAQLVAKHLNGAGAPVKAVANGAVVTLTSLASGGKANLPLAVSATGNFKIVASGKTLTGGKNASTVTQYDSGTVNFATHGATATADWGRSSTSKIIAAKLATSINKVAGTYWKATASGAVITLTSTSKPSVEASSDSADASGVTVKDSAGFTPASFSATTK